MISGFSTWKKWNGNKLKLLVIYLPVDLIAPSLTTNTMIKFSFSEEVDPIETGSIPSMLSTGKPKSGLLSPQQVSIYLYHRN